MQALLPMIQQMSDANTANRASKKNKTQADKFLNEVAKFSPGVANGAQPFLWAVDQALKSKYGKKKKKKRGGNGNRQSSVPVALSGGYASSNPKVSRNSGSTKLSHHEFFDTVETSSVAGAFQVEGFDINPGLEVLFPWLADQAKDYQEYTFQSLQLHFRTKASSSTNGSLYLAFQPNPMLPAPTSAVNFMSLPGAVSAPLWQNIAINVPSKFLRQLRYVRNGAVPGDRKMSDVGKLLIATEGAGASLSVGDLTITYSLSLQGPRQYEDRTPTMMAEFAEDSAQTVVTAIPEPLLLSDVCFEGTSGITNASGVFTLPKGPWHCHFRCAPASDSGVSSMDTILEIKEDGASLTHPALATYKADPAIPSSHTLEVAAVIVSDGTTTVQAEVTVTGPGTLSIQAYTQRAFFHVV